VKLPNILLGIFSFAFGLKKEKKKKKPPLPPSVGFVVSPDAQRMEVEIGLMLMKTTTKEEGKECQPHTGRPQTQGDFFPNQPYLPAGWG
jgi:hypothetical protein